MMTEKFKNKYRIQSHRKPDWDYSANGYYFITLVTQNRICNLGKIVGGKMNLSEFGKIVDDQWNKSFKIRAELFLDTHIIMPNHLHAIVVIDQTKTDNGPDKIPGPCIGVVVDDVVETHGRASLRRHQRQPPRREPKSISSFIAGFKSAVNSKIDDFIDEHNLDVPKYNRNNHFFQPNYHDHIIRNENEYHRVARYIINNPVKWENDKLNNNFINTVMESRTLYGDEIWMV